MFWPEVDAVMTDKPVPNPDTEPGCAVGVVRGNEIIYLKGYGYALTAPRSSRTCSEPSPVPRQEQVVGKGGVAVGVVGQIGDAPLPVSLERDRHRQ